MLPVRPEGIPPALTSRPQWVCWRQKWRGNRWTKVPYQPSGEHADSTKPGTWASFDAALAAYRKGGFHGIGFVFGTGDPYAGVDLDGCVGADGQVAPEALAIIERLDSYCEISPSGTGVKLWVIGSLLDRVGRRTTKVAGFKQIEMYDDERFFAVTGHILPGAPAAINDRAGELLDLHAEVFPSKRTRAAAHSAAAAIATEGFPGTDEELLGAARSASNGRDFSALYDRGEVSRYDDDHSVADLALCGHLAFWCGRDPERIERLFSLSALARDKWHGRLDYRQRTIAKALEGRTEFYTMSTGKRRRGKAAGAPDAEAAEPTDEARPCTDLGNAERLVARFGPDLRYCHPTGKWMTYDGMRWAQDDSGLIIHRAGLTARAIYEEAAAAPTPASRSELAEWAAASEFRPRLEAMAVLARSAPGVSVLPSQLDSDPWAFNCLSGTIDLRTGELRPHRREDLITRLAPVEYRPELPTPLWDAFLERIFAGDRELIRFVQQFLGMALTGDISEQYLVIFHGQGNNGKSVLLDTVHFIMGPYAVQAPPDLLTLSKHREHPTEIADLWGCRLVAASETEEQSQMRLQMVKRLTGDARLKGRFMRRDFFEFDRTHKLILVTNNLPVVREDSEAVWRRVRLVPFSVIIPEAERDPRLLLKLREEAGGILVWLVRGCMDWRAHGLIMPPAVRAATEQYRGEADHTGRFLADCCTLAAGLWVASGSLTKEYEQWCRERMERPLAGRKFTDGLVARGCHAGKLSGVRGWYGLELRS